MAIRRDDLLQRTRAALRRSPVVALIGPRQCGKTTLALLRQSSESLAGRIETIPMSGFGLGEVGAVGLARHWWRGGFPRSFLARSDVDSCSPGTRTSASGR